MNPVGWPAPVLEMSCSKQTTSWRNWHWESTPCQSQAQSMKPVATHWGSATPHNLQKSFQQLEKKDVLTLQISSAFFHYTLPGALLPHHLAVASSSGGWHDERLRLVRGFEHGEGSQLVRPRMVCGAQGRGPNVGGSDPGPPWWRWGWRPGSKSWPRLGWKMQLWRQTHIHWRILVV